MTMSRVPVPFMRRSMSAIEPRTEAAGQPGAHVAAFLREIAHDPIAEPAVLEDLPDDPLGGPARPEDEDVLRDSGRAKRPFDQGTKSGKNDEARAPGQNDHDARCPLIAPGDEDEGQEQDERQGDAADEDPDLLPEEEPPGIELFEGEGQQDEESRGEVGRDDLRGKRQGPGAEGADADQDLVADGKAEEEGGQERRQIAQEQGGEGDQLMGRRHIRGGRPGRVRHGTTFEGRGKPGRMGRCALLNISDGMD